MSVCLNFDGSSANLTLFIINTTAKANDTTFALAVVFIIRLFSTSAFRVLTLFSSRKILLVWEAFGWLRVICILTKACSFVSWKILTQTRYFIIFSKQN